jgi:hypothetical protein
MADRKSRKSGSSFSPEPATGPTLRRPEVIVEFIFDRGLLFIAVRNIGERHAINVSVNFNKKIMGLNGTRNISELPLFKNIMFIGPQREIKTLLDTSASYFKRKQSTKITAKISYSDAENHKYESTIDHDLQIYRELAYLNSPSDNPEAADV